MCIAVWMGLHHFEGLDVITGLYALVQIVTTIGYGDITPQSQTMRIMMSGFVIMTLVVFAYFLNALLEHLLDSVGDISKAHLSLRAGRLSNERRKLCVATLLFVCALLFGTAFYAIYEDCSCSYGDTLIAGCSDTDYDTCVETHGEVKTWVNGFYFSVITLTTVGFGDFTPETHVGRWVGIAWMILGVWSTANWIGAMSSFIFEHASDEDRKQQPAGDDLFDALGAQHDGHLSRVEHHLYFLLKDGIVTHAMLKSLNAHFDALDVNERSEITREQIERRIGSMR
ncbi:unnamed protein product [Prorocentrum cordatum]|uniref:Potassium channel domain-containing protein n=1 Tax=Prorocentrum cordatum TaxID=2364126 RepID=A0ABN9SGI5_9DINO|nr:unnamed protein product [Polarella glacialis]